jgi:hypothetical protein
MKVVFGNLEADVSTAKVSVAKLTDEPLIVELVTDYQAICEKCPTFAETEGNCVKFPFCQFIQVKKWTVPKYPTGVVQTEKGQVTVFKDGDPCPTYGRKRYVVTRGDGDQATLRTIRKNEFKGFEVLESEGEVSVEERQPFASSTSTLEITKDNLYPTGVATNFLIEATYEVYAKPNKKADETVRNTRKLYEIVKKLAKKRRVAILTGFVWKKGVYKSWAVILTPILFDDEKFLLTMKTTGANLKWLHPMTVPPEMPTILESEAPVVNNLKALGSFLEGMKTKAKPRQK